MKIKLTKRVIDGVEPNGRDQFLWDTVDRGLGLKVTAKGAKVFILQYWAKGRARRLTLGHYGRDLTVDEARLHARRQRGDIAVGRDPAGDRARARATPTLTVFAERYLSEHAGVKKKASSRGLDERNLNNHILPALGRLRVDEIGRADVARLHARMRGTPVAANRCRALLCKIFNLAEAWGLRPDGSNPTRHVQKYPESRHDRFLSDDELAALGAVLVEAEVAGENPSVIAAIRLLIFTGCRRDEILKLKWDHVDFEGVCLRLPDSKSGAKRIPLGTAALDLLAGLDRIEGNPYVLPGAVKGRHYVALEKAWGRLRARAGLRDVRLHDLRHSFASAGAVMGVSLVSIGALLGHRDAATTARYTHWSEDPARAAADRISGHMAAGLAGKRAASSAAETDENTDEDVESIGIYCPNRPTVH